MGLFPFVNPFRMVYLRSQWSEMCIRDRSLSRAEPIDVFSMLRPFVLGMCILFFDVMVLGTLNGIFSPIVQGTGMLLRDQTFDLQKYQQEKDKLRADMMAKTMMTGRVFAYNEELDAELDNMGWSEEEHTALQTMYEVCLLYTSRPMKIRSGNGASIVV